MDVLDGSICHRCFTPSHMFANNLAYSLPIWPCIAWNFVSLPSICFRTAIFPLQHMLLGWKCHQVTVLDYVCCYNGNDYPWSNISISS